MRSQFWSSIICISIMFVAAPAMAKMYKWTDENGQVHYGDAVPAQYLKKEHKEMNDQGLAVKKVKAAETEEQRAERLQLEAAQHEEKQKLAEQRRRDRVLLDTYTTERDLIAARDARLDAVDSQINLSTSIMDDSRKKLAASQKLVQGLKAQSTPIPKTLEDKINREQRQLETQQEVLQSQLEQRKSVSVQFNGYIERFRELKAEQDKLRDELTAKHKAMQDE